MSRNIQVIFILLTLILVFFVYMICRSYFNVNTALIKDEPETNTVNVLSGDLYSFCEDGFYGVKDSSGRIIIEARWYEINQLTSERFIVSKSTSGGIRYGIIDISENVIVPFIYISISDDDDEFLIGRTISGWVLFDAAGNVLIEEEWDSLTKKYENRPLTYPGNCIEAKKSGNLYRIKGDGEGNLRMTSLELRKTVLGSKTDIAVNDIPPALSVRDTHIIYNEMVDKTLKYTEALFSGDAAVIKELSWSEDYKELQLDIFRGGEPQYIGNISPVAEKTDNGITNYTCTLAVLYSKPEEIGWDGYTVTEYLVYLEVKMRKNQDGRLTVFKVRTEDGNIEDLSEQYQKSETTESTDPSNLL